MKLIQSKGLATDVITHDVSPLTVNTDAGAYSKLGWIIVLAGFIGFMLWAFLAPLDPFAVRKNTELFGERIKQMVTAISAQVAKDLAPEERREVVPEKTRPREPKPGAVPAADDPL